VLRSGLRADAETLVLVDRSPIEAGAAEEVHQSDVANLDAVRAALRGADACIHLAGISSEASFPDILHANIEGTWAVYEAARREGVGRVVFASSNHATGMYPVGEPVSAESAPRPDTYYGTSKAFGEALGRMYHDKFGLRVACLRIGTVTDGDRPENPRQLSTWLSHADCVRLFRACLTSPGLDFAILYGASANTRGWWDLAPGRELGYEPQDDAERFASEVGDAPVGKRQGGPFAEPDYTP
jgi:uronate dehydrogenase